MSLIDVVVGGGVVVVAALAVTLVAGVAPRRRVSLDLQPDRAVPADPMPVAGASKDGAEAPLRAAA